MSNPETRQRVKPATLLLSGVAAALTNEGVRAQLLRAVSGATSRAQAALTVQPAPRTAQDAAVQREQAARDVTAAVTAQATRELREGRRAAYALQRNLRHDVDVKATHYEKKAGKRLRQYDKRIARMEATLARRSAAEREGGLGTGLLIAGGLLAAGVVIARVPAVREKVLGAVDSVNPDMGRALREQAHELGKVVGTMWIERTEPAAPPAPAAKPVAQTGSSWGGSPSPNAPAADTTKTEVSKGEASAATPPDTAASGTPENKQ